MDEHISCILEYIHDLNTAARNQFTSRSTGLWWIWSGVQVLVKLWEIGYFDYEQIHCQCGIDHWFVKCFWILHYQFSILLWQISKNDFFLNLFTVYILSLYRRMNELLQGDYRYYSSGSSSNYVTCQYNNVSL